VLAFCALLAMGLAFGEMARLARQQVPDALDEHAVAWLSRHHGDWPRLDWLFHVLTRLGDPEVAYPLALAVAAVLVVLGRNRVARLQKREALFWLGVLAGGRLLCVSLKLHFQRARPPLELRRVVIGDDSFSFPSGHSVQAAVFCAMLAILLGRLLQSRPRWMRWAGWAFCCVMALLVGASRVWLGVHYPTDVIGGLALGVGWVQLAYLIRFGWRSWRTRRARAEPLAAGPSRAP
jgi:undecaprenyl-diphosphatase